MYPQSVLSKNLKKVKKFQLKIVSFSAVKNRCILYGLVFIMKNVLIRQWNPGVEHAFLPFAFSG